MKPTVLCPSCEHGSIEVLGCEGETKHTSAVIEEAGAHIHSAACHMLVKDWVNGKHGPGAQIDEKEKALILESSKGSLTDNDICHVPTEKVIPVVDHLVSIGALIHLKIVTSHKLWLRWTYQLLALCGVEFSGPMDEQMLKHDMSKFSPEEIPGYTTMFGRGTGFRKLEDPNDAELWTTALEHHYDNNPHHPEYFCTKKNGKREKTVMLEQENGMLFIEESIIDMLACRGERSLKDDETISVSKWLDLEEFYLKRYTDEDKEMVRKVSRKWQEKAKVFVGNLDTPESLNHLFGGKMVTV